MPTERTVRRICAECAFQDKQNRKDCMFLGKDMVTGTPKPDSVRTCRVMRNDETATGCGVRGQFWLRRRRVRRKPKETS